MILSNNYVFNKNVVTNEAGEFNKYTKAEPASALDNVGSAN
jgi:hypothetical protein